MFVFHTSLNLRVANDGVNPPSPESEAKKARVVSPAVVKTWAAATTLPFGDVNPWGTLALPTISASRKEGSECNNHAWPPASSVVTETQVSLRTQDGVSPTAALANSNIVHTLYRKCSESCSKRVK